MEVKIGEELQLRICSAQEREQPMVSVELLIDKFEFEREKFFDGILKFKSE